MTGFRCRAFPDAGGVTDKLLVERSRVLRGEANTTGSQEQNGMRPGWGAEKRAHKISTATSGAVVFLTPRSGGFHSLRSFDDRLISIGPPGHQSLLRDDYAPAGAMPAKSSENAKLHTGHGVARELVTPHLQPGLP